MYDKFSAEEINLMCIFDTSSRTALLAELWEKIDVIHDPEMRDIFESTIEKLEKVREDDYENVSPYFADENIEEMEDFIAE
jgi:hypothetical protein